MAYEPFVDYSQLRNKNQFDNFGIGDTYGVENPFASPPPTFQDSGPMNPTQNTDYPIQTQNSVFDRQAGGKEHPAVTDSYNRLKSIVDNIFTPSTQSSDRLNNLIDNQPQMNTPSFARKLAALGTGLGNIGPGFTSQGGGTDAMDRVLHAPYLQQMAAWKEKLAPAQAAATNESQRNIQERTLATNMMTAMTADDRNRVAQQNNDDKNEIARQRNEDANKVATFREQTRRIIAENPDWKPDYSGTKVKMVNTKTGEMRVTNQDTDKLSEQDKLDIEGANRVNTARATGAGNVRIGNQEYIPDPNKPGNYIPATGLPTDQGPPVRMGGGSGATKPNSSELNKERQDRMREIYERNGNESNVTQFLHPDATNKGYTLEPRPVLGSKKTWGMFGGVTQKDLDTWDLIKQEVDPGYTVPPNPKGESAPASTGQSQTPSQSQQSTPSVGPTLPGAPLKRDSTSSLWGSAPPAKPQSSPDAAKLAAQQNWDYQNSPQYVKDQIDSATAQLNDPNFTGNRDQVYDHINLLNQQLQSVQKQKASDFLRANGKPVTPANIDYVIKNGGVQ